MRPQTEQTYQERVLRVLVYIQKHLDETISLDVLACVAHFSPFHFHRVFRGMVGESVSEHVRRLRLERAAHQLKFSDDPIVHIALGAGYETHESFTRAFRLMFDEAPSQFRDSQRALPFPKVASGVHYVADGRSLTFEQPPSTGTPHQARIEQVAPTRVAFMRHVGRYADVGGTWGRLMSWAGPRGLIGPRPTLLGIVHDDPDITPGDKIRYDACLVIDERFKPEGDVGAQELSAGAYAVATHRGPYHELGRAYAWLCGQWLPSIGRETRSDPSFEVYRNSPMDAAPADLLTDVYIPIE